MTDPGGPLAGPITGILERFATTNAAREAGLASCRRVIRLSANSIRAIHREDAATANALLGQAAEAHREARAALDPHPEVRFAGFLHDAQKEYAEAAATVALLSGQPLPEPAQLGVEDAAYLNGVAETIGELRRVVLDRLRAGRMEGCEAILQQMDDIYSVLVTVDFPDAMTGGLRRTTDQARAILERTRGDLALSVVVARAAGGASTGLASGD